MKKDTENTVVFTRHSMVGVSADRFVMALPNLLPEVTHLTFAYYAPGAGLENRLSRALSSQAQAELNTLKATSPKLHEELARLLAFFGVPEISFDAALNEMLNHDDSPEAAREVSLDVHTLVQHGITPLQSAVPSGQVLGLSSLCRVSGGSTAHIPMLDCHVPVAPRSLDMVVTAARKLGLSQSVVLESGRSYHVYGLCLLSQAEWSRFLARALLLGPVFDVRYIAHRLLAGRSVLRIGTTPIKPHMPHIVAAY